MPHYTTSYSTNKKRPARRRATATGEQLPAARRRAQHKPGVQYLRHSQGFGHSNHGRRGSSRPRKRNPYALVAVGCALLLFVASLIWYANRNVDVELNGSTVQVRINSSIQSLIDAQDISVRAGNLLAVDDSVITKRGGEKISVKLGKKQIDNSELDSVKLTGGEKLTIGNGRDLYEDHEVVATDIQPSLSFEGSGAIQYVATWPKLGRSEVWTGKISGKTYDRGVVKEAQDGVVVCASAKPDSGKYVALTFNGAPSSYTDQILSILEEKGAAATFFLTGENASAYSSQAKAIVSAGCEVGSYGTDGTSLANFTGNALRNEVEQGLDQVSSATGSSTLMLRSSGGKLTETQWGSCMDLVAVAVAWSMDSGDWLLPGAETVIETVASGAGNGSIIAMTDNEATSAQTVEALPSILERLQEEGYKVVSVSELIAQNAELSDAINMKKVSMPKGAVLPTVTGTDSGTSDDAANDEAA